MIRSRAVLVLLGAHLVMKVLTGLRAAEAPLQGDEVAYADSAAALSNLLRDLVGLGPVDTSVAADVVGHGWFMPGMSIVLTPLYVVDPDPSLLMVRGYLGLISLALTLLVAIALVRTFGPAYSAGFLLVPTLLPMWTLFSFTAWGDLYAGLVAVLLLCAATAAGRRLAAGRPPSVGQGAMIGLLAIIALYLRSSALPLAAGLLLLLGVACLLALRGRDRRRGLIAAAAAAGVFGALLLPWSLTASAVLDGRVVTTSTVPLSTAVAFGDEQRLCLGPCADGNVWFAMARYSREVAVNTGASELTVQRQMSDYARSDVTAQGYARDVLEDLGRYALRPGDYEPVFHEVPGSPPDRASPWIRTGTEIGYGVTGALALLGLLVVVRRRVDHQVTSLLLKLSVLALFVQPFVHVCTARYWPIYGPFIGVTLAWGWDVVRSRGGPAGAMATGSPAVRRWLTVAQAITVAATLALALALVLVSR